MKRAPALSIIYTRVGDMMRTIGGTIFEIRARDLACWEAAACV
jgi:hypothetical protein